MAKIYTNKSAVANVIFASPNATSSATTTPPLATTAPATTGESITTSAANTTAAVDTAVPATTAVSGGTVTSAATTSGNPTKTVTTSAITVPTPRQAPPTVPVGISPAVKPPTVPVGISPGIVNNNAISEETFSLNLNGYTAQASIEYPLHAIGPFTTILMFQPFGLYDIDATVTTSRYGIGSRNYKLMADQWAARGYAVVRYTKRGYDASGQDQAPTENTPVDQLFQDAKAAYTQIQSNQKVNPKQIILLAKTKGQPLQCTWPNSNQM